MKEQKHLMDKTYRTAYIQPVELARTHVKTKTDKRGERKTKQKTHNLSLSVQSVKTKYERTETYNR